MQERSAITRPPFSELLLQKKKRRKTYPRDRRFRARACGGGELR